MRMCSTVMGESRQRVHVGGFSCFSRYTELAYSVLVKQVLLIACRKTVQNHMRNGFGYMTFSGKLELAGELHYAIRTKHICGKFPQN